MTVGQLRATMTGDEWIHWQMYYARKAQRRELENASQHRR